MAFLPKNSAAFCWGLRNKPPNLNWYSSGDY
jgi:hypothetical protein